MQFIPDFENALHDTGWKPVILILNLIIFSQVLIVQMYDIISIIIDITQSTVHY
jgi:hypothetical protein